MTKRLKNIFTNVVFWLAVTFLVIVVVARIANGQGTGSGNTPTKIERNGSSAEINTNADFVFRLRVGHVVEFPASSCTGAAVAPSGKIRLCSNGTDLLFSRNGAAYVVLTPPSGGVGTVQSVAAAVPAFMQVLGSPITTTGTLGFSFNSQTQATVFAAPAGSSGSPQFIALEAGHIPGLNVSKLIAGTLSPARGGTGLAPTFALFDIPFADTTTTWGKLTANVTNTRKFLFTEGNNTIANNGGYAALLSSDIPPVSFATNANGGIAAGTVLGFANGGTNRTSIGGAQTVLSVSDDGASLVYRTLTGNGSQGITVTTTNSQYTVGLNTAVVNKWNNLQNPTTDLTLTMAGNRTGFIWTDSGSSDSFTINDNAGSGSGHVAAFTTTTASTRKPWTATALGVGFEIDASGALTNVGASTINTPSLTIARGSVTGGSGLSLTSTWTGGGTFPGSILVNITDTSSNAASLFADLQVGGVSKFNVRKDGQIAVGGNSFLISDAANILACRNSTNPCTVRAYSTFTDANNYERLSISFNGASFIVGVENAGTGSNSRNLVLASSGNGSLFLGSSTNFWKISGSTGHLIPVTTGAVSIGDTTHGVKQLFFDATNTTTGTTGNQTINKASGTVNVAAAASSLTVTNSLVTVNSLVFLTTRTNDATCSHKNAVPAAGSFTINMTANCTAETSVGFMVINQ